MRFLILEARSFNMTKFTTVTLADPSVIVSAPFTLVSKPMAITTFNCFLVETVGSVMVAFTTFHATSVSILGWCHGIVFPSIVLHIDLFPCSAPKSGIIKVIICLARVPLLAYRRTLSLPQRVVTWWDLGSTTSLLGFSRGRTSVARSALTSDVVPSGGYFALLRRCLLGRTRPRAGARARAGTGACLRGSLLRMNTQASSWVISELETHWNCQFIWTLWS